MPVHAPGDARINHLFHLNFKLRTRPCSAAGMHRQSFAARPILDLLWVTLEMNWTTVTHIPSQIHAQRERETQGHTECLCRKSKFNLLSNAADAATTTKTTTTVANPNWMNGDATSLLQHAGGHYVAHFSHRAQPPGRREDSNSLPSIGSELFIFGPPATRSATHVLHTVPSGGSRGFAAWRGFGYR